MSASPAVPIHSGVSFSAYTSADPKCSITFGQVLFLSQREKMLPVGCLRTGSGQSAHHCGPSLPCWASSSTPSGWAQREFAATRRPAMIGQAPS